MAPFLKSFKFLPLTYDERLFYIYIFYFVINLFLGLQQVWSPFPVPCCHNFLFFQSPSCRSPRDIAIKGVTLYPCSSGAFSFSFFFWFPIYKSFRKSVFNHFVDMFLPYLLLSLNFLCDSY